MSTDAIITKTVGTCSLCHGPVEIVLEQEYRHSAPKCSACGAVAVNEYGPLFATRKSAPPVADGPAAHSNFIPTDEKLESEGPAGFSDQERVKFLLSFIQVGDIGEDQFIPGVIVNQEELDSSLSKAAQTLVYESKVLFRQLRDDPTPAIDEAIRAARKDI